MKSLFYLFGAIESGAWGSNDTFLGSSYGFEFGSNDILAFGSNDSRGFLTIIEITVFLVLDMTSNSDLYLSKSRRALSVDGLIAFTFLYDS